MNVDDVDVNEENEENYESKNQLNQLGGTLDDHYQENPQRDSDMDSEE